MIISDTFQEGMDLVESIFAKAREKTTQRQKEKGRPLVQIKKYLNSKIKNDDKLVEKILWIYFSAYTANPINLGIMAPSSEGKTYASVVVSSIFPKEDIISVGRMSPTALIHQNGILVDENLNSIENILELLDNDIAEGHNLIQKNIIKPQSESNTLEVVCT